MDQQMSSTDVATMTAAAVHRRDHQHDGDACHPHVVEVVHLGRSATVVCHDCHAHTGFVTDSEAAAVAAEHRAATVTDSVRLPGTAA